MSKANALAGIICNYGDSDDESDDGGPSLKTNSSISRTSAVKPSAAVYSSEAMSASYASPSSTAAIHPAPIPHCPWSACYDENSGFTYYWNQQTNAVTWEAPPEYLLALKLAQQHLNTSGSTEVSAEEWQLYQQALAEKQNSQNKVISKAPSAKPIKKAPATTPVSKATKRRKSDDEDVKIELITSYHNSDSDSNEETESPVRKVETKKPLTTVIPPKVPKIQPKKSKKSVIKPMEYGPTLPPNQNYSMPIGPELPSGIGVETELKLPDKTSVNPPRVMILEETKTTKVSENEDSQDETLLLTKLKDKAKLLEKLGGEIPVELQKIIQDETSSKPASPKVTDEVKDTKAAIDTNIDDLLEEIEKKELPKVKTKNKLDMFSETKSSDNSPKNTPSPDGTPPRDEVKPLFPSSKNITDEPVVPTSLCPSAASIIENGIDKEKKEVTPAVEKKNTNVYLMDAGEVIENVSRKKLRISNSVLPVKKSEPPSYTTKYSQSIDGFIGERTGLGFSKDDEEDSPKNDTAVSYGNGLMFTKGETINEAGSSEDLEDMANLVEAKLKYLIQVQTYTLTPIQEMMIQMQTLSAAWAAGGLARSYWRRWVKGASAALGAHEAAAAPPGWLCAFQRSEGRYRYERESDGLVQWEYPATANMDMDICTTPPHPGLEAKECQPPLPPLPPPQPVTPPPPAWDPPPPGCDAPPTEVKQEIGDELQSFYNDIAELEKQTPSAPLTAASSPEPVEKEKEKNSKDCDKDRDKDKGKKKSKVKISSSIGMKHKSVSNLVAKWQQVAEEINSD